MPIWKPGGGGGGGGGLTIVTDRGIDPIKLGAKRDGTDAVATTAAVVAALAAVAAGDYSYVKVTPGDYFLQQIIRNTSPIIIGTDDANTRWIIDEASFGTSDGPWLCFEGTRSATEYPLTANALALAYSIPLSAAHATALAAAGAGPNTVILLGSELEFEPSFRVGEREGQLVAIESIDTGTGVIQLREALARDFLLANTPFVSLPTMLERPTFGGITLWNNLPDSNRAIQLAVSYGRDVDIDYVSRYPDSAACQIGSCYGGKVVGDVAYMQNDNPGIQYGYGMSIAGASAHIECRIRAVQCRHGWTTVASFGAGGFSEFHGTPNHIDVTGQAYQCTSDAFDTHPGGDNIHFHDITAVGCKSAGAQLRSRNSHIHGGLIEGCPDGARVDITSGKWSIRDLTIKDTHRNATNPDYTNTGQGIRIENTGLDGVIADCIFENIWCNVVRYGGGVPANTAIHDGLDFVGNTVRSWNLGSVGANDAAIIQANGASVNNVKLHRNTFHHLTANDRIWNGTIFGGACEHGDDNHHIAPPGVTPQGINSLVRCQGYSLNGSRIVRRLTVAFATTIALDVTLAGMFAITLTNNITSFTMVSPTGTFENEFELLVIQDAVGGRTIAFPASIRWPNGTAPRTASGVGSAPASSREWFKFRWDGSAWRVIGLISYAT